MAKFVWGLNALLVVAVAAMAYMFVIRGSVSASNDGRTTILLSAGERDLILTEMRGFLESIEAITNGLASKDMKKISSSASKVGMANAQDVPASLRGKLPLAFKKLGMSTHKAFDDLAMEAQDLGDPQIVLTKLGKLLNNCTSCHAGYRLGIESDKEN